MYRKVSYHLHFPVINICFFIVTMSFFEERKRLLIDYLANHVLVSFFIAMPLICIIIGLFGFAIGLFGFGIFKLLQLIYYFPPVFIVLSWMGTAIVWILYAIGIIAAFLLCCLWPISFGWLYECYNKFQTLNRDQNLGRGLGFVILNVFSAGGLFLFGLILCPFDIWNYSKEANEYFVKYYWMMLVPAVSVGIYILSLISVGLYKLFMLPYGIFRAECGRKCGYELIDWHYGRDIAGVVDDFV